MKRHTLPNIRQGGWVRRLAIGFVLGSVLLALTLLAMMIWQAVSGYFR